MNKITNKEMSSTEDLFTKHSKRKSKNNNQTFNMLL